MSGAAAELGYVPSAVSQQITALERSLGGAELLSRKSGRRVSVTATGRALAEAVEDLLTSTASFQDALRGLSLGEGVDIRVGAYGTAMSYLLPEAVNAQRSSSTAATIKIFEVETIQGMPLLERGELDVLIAARYRRDDPPRPSSRLVIHSLGDEPLVLASAEAHGSDLTFERCKFHDWVAGTPMDVDRKNLDRWAGDLGFTPHVRYETADYHTAVELIAADMAVGLLPATVMHAPRNKPRLSAIPMPNERPGPHREIFAVTRRRYRVPAIEDLLTHLSEIVGEKTGL